MRNIVITSVLLLLGLVCCDTKHDTTIEEGTRIVSLSPGITNTIIHAGFGDFIVGKSAFCFLADPSIPVVGDLREVDFERLLMLRPTDVFMQQTAAGAHAHLVALAEQGEFALHIYPIDRVDEIQRLYGAIVELYGGNSMNLELLEACETQLPSPVLVVTQGTAGSAGLSFGRETYMDDMLHAMEVENVVRQSGWVSLSLEDIGRLEPKVIIVVSDSEIKESSLQSLRSLGIQVLPFVHEHVVVPSSYLSEVAKEFKELNIEQ